MTARITTAAMVRFDKWSWYFFVVCFGIVLLLQIFSAPAATPIAYAAIVLVLINSFIRIFLLAEQFVPLNRPRYRMLSYLLIVVLVAAIGVQLLIRK